MVRGVPMNPSKTHPIKDLLSSYCPTCGTRLRRKAISAPALDAYLKEAMAGYIEPSRKGTPKGEPVGFSRTKYKATILALRGPPVKKQAAELKVRYTVLLSWRALPEFKTFVRAHIERITGVR